MVEDKAKKRGRGHYLEGALRGSHDGGLPVKEVVADGSGGALGGRVAAQVLKFLVDSLQSHFVGGGGGGVWARRRWRRWSGREVDGVTRLRRWLRREGGGGCGFEVFSYGNLLGGEENAIWVGCLLPSVRFVRRGEFLSLLSSFPSLV